MLIFIDDSGDPDFKLQRGSSSYFVIALLIFDDSLEAEKMAVAIKELRRSLRFPDTQEFKYAQSKNAVRVQFLKTVCRFSFRVRAVVVDKSKVYSDELRNKRESFYSYFIKMVLKNSNQSIFDAKIKIDGSGDRQFRKEFLGYLRRELNTSDRRIIKNCKFADSKENQLIQAADMIAGAIRRMHEVHDNEPYRVIKKHISDEWKFG